MAQDGKGIPKGEWLRFNKPETCRTYIFPTGRAEFYKVIGLAVSPNGTHYLQTADNEKFIVHSGWLYIELVIDEWTYPGPFQFNKTLPQVEAEAELPAATWLVENVSFPTSEDSRRR